MAIARSVAARRYAVAAVWQIAAAASLLAVPSWAHAHGSKWTFEDATFHTCLIEAGIPCAPGGQVTGYVVLNDVRTGITDWAVFVQGGAEEVFPPFVYDPTTATARVVTGVPDIRPHIVLSALDETRHLIVEFNGIPTVNDRLLLGGREMLADGTTTRQLSGDLTTDFAPVLSLKVNGQHPGTRVVTSTGGFRLSLDVLPSAQTGPFDWYWAFIVNGTVYWVTPTGLSLTLGSLGRQSPTHVDDLTLLDQVLPPGQYTSVMFLVDGLRVVSGDLITTQVGP